MVENNFVSKGGPILMLQIENEYGYYGKNNEWPKKLTEMWKNAGVKSVPLYQADTPHKHPLEIGHVDNAAVGLV